MQYNMFELCGSKRSLHSDWFGQIPRTIDVATPKDKMHILHKMYIAHAYDEDEKENKHNTDGDGWHFKTTRCYERWKQKTWRWKTHDGGGDDDGDSDCDDDGDGDADGGDRHLNTARW